MCWPMGRLTIDHLILSDFDLRVLGWDINVEVWPIRSQHVLSIGEAYNWSPHLSDLWAEIFDVGMLTSNLEFVVGGGVWGGDNHASQEVRSFGCAILILYLQ